jgi:hypothetical protein
MSGFGHCRDTVHYPFVLKCVSYCVAQLVILEQMKQKITVSFCATLSNPTYLIFQTEMRYAAEAK